MHILKQFLEGFGVRTGLLLIVCAGNSGKWKLIGGWVIFLDFFNIFIDNLKLTSF